MTIETKHTTLYSVLFVAACTRCSDPLLLRLRLPLTLVSLPDPGPKQQWRAPD